MGRQMTEDLIFQVAAGLNQTLVSEYHAQEELFFAQSAAIQRTLEIQAGLISRALIEDRSPLLFNLPDQVARVGEGSAEWVLYPVPRDQREQKLGRFFDSVNVSDLSRHLKELESSNDGAVATCGRLIRHAVARHLVHRQLPHPQNGNGRGSVPGYALGFFLPQWVAFDEQDNLLVNSLDEAKARLAAMQHYLSILKAAERLAPYICVDEDFQRKQVGILAQLINQGYAMARHLNGVMIHTIQRRADENSLNRGMSLSLPYFDDQALEIRYLKFEVIPRGRIMFVPAFVVIAAKLKQMEVAHSSGFSFTTQAHLLAELETLERAFDEQNGPHFSERTR